MNPLTTYKFQPDFRLGAAWIISIAATLGSLYFSEIKGYIPCDLCWFQRIFMYPLTILLGIAYYKKDLGIMKYVLPLSCIGGAISVYHIAYQRFYSLFSNHGLAACGPTPCNVNYFTWLGFITIPVMALTAFLLITVLLWSLSRAAKAAGAGTED
ncbi:disulfide bond formation protein B [Paenibacillus glucanolyticus]|jgi:disulfide bond formation protein DsbB|uniref:disulfide oxidoreductase n=1 Tax=Paenibacillus TaxID=44249 RepID=UPI0005689D67|nr:disulfide oxidoreductase [Paenibacillus vortex]ANA81840.1 disulfide oxidoreductase [Paenibacillus glucanolyticus]AVV59428.1 disulfide bond formation protein B [Paenibacillus glucanolyticus]